MFIQPIEDELMIGGKYLQQRPQIHGSSAIDQRQEVRRINNPADASYMNIHMRYGTTTLHIAEWKTLKNLDALIFVYTGATTYQAIGSTSASALRTSEIGLVTLADNGVVSVCYTEATKPVVCVLSFGEYGYAGHPYPSDEKIIHDTMRDIMTQSGFLNPDAPACKALPFLAMLAITTSRDLSPA